MDILQNVEKVQWKDTAQNLHQIKILAEVFMTMVAASMV